MRFEKLITILAGRKKPGGEQKSPVRPSVIKRPLARRRLGGIRFWDLGYIKSGEEYINLPYTDTLSALPVTWNTDNTRNNSRAYTPMGLADYQASLYDTIFDVPVEEWTENYKQIDETMTQYKTLNVIFNAVGYTLTTASANWSNGVFRPDSFGAGLIAIDWEDLAIASLGNSTPGALKVTAEYDYSASEVAFTFGRNCDIFIVPAVYDLRAYVTINLPTSPVTGHQELLNELTGIGPREAFFDPSHEYFERVEGFNTIQSWGLGGSGADYTTVHDLVRYWQEYEPHRARQAARSGPTLSPIYTDAPLAVADFAPIAQWPDPPFSPDTTGYVTYALTVFSTQHAGAETGRLLAVVKQSGQYYYIWANY